MHRTDVTGPVGVVVGGTLGAVAGALGGAAAGTMMDLEDSSSADIARASVGARCTASTASSAAAERFVERRASDLLTSAANSPSV